MVETLTGTGLNPDHLPFPGVIGQADARNLILRAIRSDRLAHAYLFLGPEGSGKLSLALELARFLNCREDQEIAAFTHCNCQSCRQMRTWRHPNLLPVFPLPKLDLEKGEPAQKALNAILATLGEDVYSPLKFEKTGQILIDQVRELRNMLSLMPDLPGVRVAIISPADKMNPNAANALLKHLEEPPPLCLLILIAESSRELLPTVVSRCQQVRLAPLDTPTIEDALIARRGLDQEHAKTVAVLARGNFTRAIQLAAEQTESLIGESLDFLRRAVVGDVQKMSEEIDRWTSGETGRAERADLQERLDFTNLWLHDALVAKAYGSNASENLQIRRAGQSAEKMASRYRVEQIEQVITEIEETRLALDSNAVASLALTALAIKINRVLM